MTKLDGTARGGILVALAEKFGLPVHFIGVGEGIDDLAPFTARDFANAIAGIESSLLSRPRRRGIRYAAALTGIEVTNAGSPASQAMTAKQSVKWTRPNRIRCSSWRPNSVR